MRRTRDRLYVWGWNRPVIAVAAFLLAGCAAEAAYRVFLFAQNRLLAGHRGEGTYELYAIGGSTMAGEPYEPYAPIPLLASGILKDRAGGRRIVIRNLARSGESIYPQAHRLEKALRYRDRSRPGALFIYAGHNDSSLADLQEPGFYEILKEKVFSRSFLLSDLAFYGESARLLPRVRTLDTYEHYMARAVRSGLSNGLTPILSTVISNVSGIDPGLFQGSKLPRDRTVLLIKNGESLEQKRRYREAGRYYEHLLGSDPSLDPFLDYLIGRCQERLGAYEAANRHYWRAIDSAGKDNFGRARSRQNGFIRALAKEYSLPLVDAVKLFESHSPHGLVGDSLFIDGHHPDIGGYFLLATAFAQALSRASGEPAAGIVPDRPGMPPQASIGKKEEVFALVMSGSWLVIVSVRHLYPAVRLGLAEKRFREAAALDPDYFSAWLGLGLAIAAQRTSWLQDESEIAWLERNGLFSGGRYMIPKDSLQAIISKLRDSGVPEGILDNIRLTHARSGT